MAVVLVLAAVRVAAPIGAAVLVSIASRREESAYSLAGRPPGRLEAAARRLLAFRAYGITIPGQPRVPRPRAGAETDPDRYRMAAPRS